MAQPMAPAQDPALADRSGRSTGMVDKSGRSLSSHVKPVWVGDGPSQHSWRKDGDISQHGQFSGMSKYVPERSELDIKGYIASGTCGTVHKANFRGIPVAVKFLKDGSGPTSTQYKDFMHEVKIHLDLAHPNIVALMAANTDETPPFCIFERMDGGSLEDYLVKKATPVGRRGVKRKWLPPRHMARNWVTDVLRGLTYMHESQKKIVHRDLKPANLLLTADHKTVKITDFGLAKIMINSSGQRRPMTGGTGTLRFMAPEVYMKDANYTEKVDIYSLAIIMSHLVTGQMPFSEATNMDALAKKVANEGVRPSLKGADWVEILPLIEKAWSHDPAQRPSALEMLQQIHLVGGVTEGGREDSKSLWSKCICA